MTSPAVDHRTPDADVEHPYWRRNLAVGTAGSFTTLVAMTLLVPFLPEYVRQLGVDDPGAVVRWSGVAYGATFLTAALTAPLWGALGDRFGRKSMLVRASLGMAVAMTLLGFVQSVEQLVAVRLLVGLLGGYSSGATILVAAQTPKDRSAWALGVLSSGILAGNVVGPLVGGFVPAWVGIRPTFVVCGAVIFLAFLAFGVYALLRPDDLTVIAGWVGVGRGTDLVLYGLVVAFAFTTISTYLRFRDVEIKYARLARSVALQNAALENQRPAGTPEPGQDPPADPPQ